MATTHGQGPDLLVRALAHIGVREGRPARSQAGGQPPVSFSRSAASASSEASVPSAGEDDDDEPVDEPGDEDEDEDEPFDSEDDEPLEE